MPGNKILLTVISHYKEATMTKALTENWPQLSHETKKFTIAAENHDLSSISS